MQNTNKLLHLEDTIFLKILNYFYSFNLHEDFFLPRLLVHILSFTFLYYFISLPISLQNC